jgi:hypothetical protein
MLTGIYNWQNAPIRTVFCPLEDNFFYSKKSLEYQNYFAQQRLAIVLDIIKKTKRLSFIVWFKPENGINFVWESENTHTLKKLHKKNNNKKNNKKQQTNRKQNKQKITKKNRVFCRCAITHFYGNNLIKVRNS